MYTRAAVIFFSFPLTRCKMKMSSNGVEIVKQSGNTVRTKYGETLVAFAVSMDTAAEPRRT